MERSVEFRSIRWYASSCSALRSPLFFISNIFIFSSSGVDSKPGSHPPGHSLRRLFTKFHDAGTIYSGYQPTALQAYPTLDKRSDDLYSAFFIAAVGHLIGVDINNIVGESTRKPYYFPHLVCSGNCNALTAHQRQVVDLNARNSRAIISCFDTNQVINNPDLVPLPFTSETSSFDETVVAATGGAPAIFRSVQAEEDHAAASSISEAPLGDLFAPVSLLPALADAVGVPVPALAPAAAPSPAPVAAPAPGPAGVINPIVDAGFTAESGSGGDNGGSGGRNETGVPGDGNPGVRANQANSMVDDESSASINWILVAVGFVAAIILGLSIMLGRQLFISMGYTCCQFSACGPLLGLRKGSESAGGSDVALAPLDPPVVLPPPVPASDGIGTGSAFDSGSVHEPYPLLAGAASTDSLEGMGHSMGHPIATAGSGSGAITREAGVSKAASVTLNLPAASASGGIGRSGSHSGSVSLAHLTANYHPGISSSRGGDSAENSGGAAFMSGDSVSLAIPLSTAGQETSENIPSTVQEEGVASVQFVVSHRASTRPPVAMVPGSMDRGRLAVNELHERSLGTVFEVEAPQNPPSGRDDSEGLPKPLSMINVTLENQTIVGDARSSDPDDEEYEGASGDALLGGYFGTRSDTNQNTVI